MQAVEDEALSGPHACATCGRVADFGSEYRDAGGGIDRCPVCGAEDLYVQRDFNRRLGLLLLLVAAILALPTKGISLVVAALADFALYRLLPSVTVCYFCEAIFRGFPRSPSHSTYDADLSDRYWWRRKKEEEEKAGREPGTTPPQVEREH